RQLALRSPRCSKPSCIRAPNPAVRLLHRSTRSSTAASGAPNTPHHFVVAHDVPLSQLIEPFLYERVLIRAQFDVVADRFVDQIAARPVLCSGERVEGFNCFGVRAEAD